MDEVEVSGEDGGEVARYDVVCPPYDPSEAIVVIGHDRGWVGAAGHSRDRASEQLEEDGVVDVTIQSWRRSCHAPLVCRLQSRVSVVVTRGHVPFGRESG